MMAKFRWMVRLAVLTILLTLLNPITFAQTPIRRGVLLLNQVRMLSARSTTLSGGSLVDLRTDPNFEGNYQTIVDAATTILNGYIVVKHGGYFPENRGIPRNQQLSWSEVVYYIFTLPNGKELFLYRSPLQNTAEYFIRRKD
ncbi:hypothetical protein [Leptothermofonsia sp. ETS-13]|uniref:hypothetical protein n=1 Tax=Leptothermofonsia sp. ETS-13 TaxID=3035696 RepID=UPI003BA1199A